MNAAIICVGLAIMAIGVYLVGQFWWQTSGSQGQAKAESASMVKSLESDWQQSKPEAADAVDPETVNPSENGTPFAVMEIPRFGASWTEPVIQGTELAELGIGVGHEPGTAMPGQVGNVGMAGHRTTYGRPFHKIADLRKGDKVVVNTSTTTYTYTVRSKDIVKPDAVEVFAAVPNKPGAKPTKAMMTLSSCHPFYQDSERYVVFTELTKTVKR